MTEAAAPASVTPIDPATLVAGLMIELTAITDRLTHLVATETQLIETTETPDIAPLAPEKGRLTVRYDAMLRHLQNCPRALVATHPAMPTLRAAAARLNSIATQNAYLLDLKIKGTRRAMDVIAQAASKATETNFTYGKERNGYGARSARNAAVAINRVF